MTGYIDVWEFYGEGQHANADRSPIIEDLYSLELELMDTYVANLFPLLF